MTRSILNHAYILAGYCDNHGIQCPTLERIAEPLHYVEQRGVLGVDEIAPLFGGICEACAKYGTSVPQVFGLFIACSSVGIDKTLCWGGLRAGLAMRVGERVMPIEEDRAQRFAAAVQTHSRVSVDALHYAAAIEASFWNVETAGGVAAQALIASGMWRLQ